MSLLNLHFTCPACKKDFIINGYWRWIWRAPFHGWVKRKTKCPHCQKKSWMAWHTITRS